MARIDGDQRRALPATGSQGIWAAGVEGAAGRRCRGIRRRALREPDGSLALAGVGRRDRGEQKT